MKKEREKKKKKPSTKPKQNRATKRVDSDRPGIVEGLAITNLDLIF